MKLSFQIDGNDAAASAPIRSRLSHQYAEACFSVIGASMPFAKITRCDEGRNNEFLARVFKPLSLFGHSLSPIIKGTEIGCFFKENGSNLKGKALIALNTFLRNARLLLKYLGC